MLLQTNSAEQATAQKMTRGIGPIAIEFDSGVEIDWRRRGECCIERRDFVQGP